MPIYEYTCSACGHGFEQLIRSQDEERGLRCPSCGKKKVDRQFSVIAAPRAAAEKPLPQAGCGRCGDPNGACPFQ